MIHNTKLAINVPMKFESRKRLNSFHVKQFSGADIIFVCVFSRKWSAFRWRTDRVTWQKVLSTDFIEDCIFYMDASII